LFFSTHQKTFAEGHSNVGADDDAEVAGDDARQAGFVAQFFRTKSQLKFCVYYKLL